jgi:hypothetical protein
MTIGPDDFDLTDDNGRLRPEVARALQEVPDHPLPLPREMDRPVAVAAGPAPAAPIAPAAAPRPVHADAPWPAAAAPRWQGPPPIVLDQPRPGLPVREIRFAVPDLAAARVPLSTFMVILALTAVAAGYAGSRFAKPDLRTGTTKPEVAALSQGTSLIQPEPSVSPVQGTVSGINVNLRTGPGIAYSVASKLQDGERIAIRDERMGWYSASTSSGASGWVFGAYVSGLAGADRGPAIMRRLVVSGVGAGQVVLRPGQRVLHLRTADGRSAALLPDGRQVGVEEGGLIDVR